MNEEEKEAIKRIKIYIKNKERCSDDYQGKILSNYMETLIHLIEKQQKEIENLKLRKDNKVIINKIDQITKEYYELFNKKMSLESMNINGHRYNAMKMVLEEILSGQESDQEGGQDE